MSIKMDLGLGTSEIERLRGADLKDLLHERELLPFLDLYHTLINSSKLHNMFAAENDLGIQTTASKGDPIRGLFPLETMQMLTKLGLFVCKFLKEASNMFEIYIYTMRDKTYAIEIAKLLDPDNVYFGSKVISNSDCTQRHQKGLDVVPGAESIAVILDDTEYVIKRVRQSVLQGCKLFSLQPGIPVELSPTVSDHLEHGEQLGAVCHADVDLTVTHVVALGWERSRLAGLLIAGSFWSTPTGLKLQVFDGAANRKEISLFLDQREIVKKKLLPVPTAA